MDSNRKKDVQKRLIPARIIGQVESARNRNLPLIPHGSVKSFTVAGSLSALVQFARQSGVVESGGPGWNS